MDTRELKEYIIDNNRVEDILNSLNMHNIVQHGNYWSCSWPDGDNPSGLIVYDNLNTLANTRNIADAYGNQDIITVVQFVEKLNFFEAMKFICDVLGVGVYDNLQEDLPVTLRFMKTVKGMCQEENRDEDIPLRPIDKRILKYFHTPIVNDVFKNDGISYETQTAFNIGFDEESNRITIPIYTALGDLVGIKGRKYDNRLDYINENKYYPLVPYPKGRILYGLEHTLPYIQQEHLVYVTEAEKGVMQLWSAGVFNSVATGGCKMTKHQAEELVRIGAKIVLCYDQDVDMSQLQAIKALFPERISIYTLVDEKSNLKPKNSPTDQMEVFNEMKQSPKRIA